MRPVIVVFAKAPVPGRVKTRLQPEVPAQDAARLHSAFVRDTLRNLLDFPTAVLELHTDIDTDAWSEFAVPRRLQHEGDLGLRMFHALETALSEGHPQAMILGSDAPDLPAGHVVRLLASHADVALGPCEDGGYYAIAARAVSPQMFDGVEWSSSRACAQTEAACRAAGLSVELGLPWYDIDQAADLARIAGSERAAESAAAVRRLDYSMSVRRLQRQPALD